MENHQTQSKPAAAEQPSPEGLSSSALFSLLRDAWYKRGKWREEWRCRFGGDSFTNIYRGIRREKPRSSIRVQMLYLGKVWVDVPGAPGGSTIFIEENTLGLASPAGSEPSKP